MGAARQDHGVMAASEEHAENDRANEAMKQVSTIVCCVIPIRRFPIVGVAGQQLRDVTSLSVRLG